MGPAEGGVAAGPHRRKAGQSFGRWRACRRDYTAFRVRPRSTRVDFRISRDIDGSGGKGTGMRAGMNWRPRPKTAPTWKHGRRSVTGFMKKPAPTARRGSPKHAPCAGRRGPTGKHSAGSPAPSSRCASPAGSVAPPASALVLAQDALNAPGAARAPAAPASPRGRRTGRMPQRAPHDGGLVKNGYADTLRCPARVAGPPSLRITRDYDKSARAPAGAGACLRIPTSGSFFARATGHSAGGCVIRSTCLRHERRSVNRLYPGWAGSRYRINPVWESKRSPGIQDPL